MVTIFKAKDNLYCIGVNSLIKKYNLVILIDNFHMEASVSNEIMKNIPFYIKQNAKLIVTYPTIKIYDIDETNLFSILHKIKCHSNKKKSVDKNIYTNSIKLLNEQMENIPNSYVIVFTDLVNCFYNEIVNNLKNIYNTENVILKVFVSNKPANTESFIIDINDFDNNCTDLMEYKDNINVYNLVCGNNVSQCFVNFFVNNKTDSFLKDIFINDTIQSFLINNTEITVNTINFNINFYLDCIYHLIMISKYKHEINNEPVFNFCNKELDQIISNNNGEIRLKALEIKSLFKTTINNIVLDEIQTLDDNKIKKSINDYCKKIRYIEKNVKSANSILQNIDKWKNNDLINKNLELINKDTKMFKNSCDFYMSNIMLSNWFEELENNSCMGLLTYINTSSLVQTNQLYNKHTIKVKQITNSYLSVTDYVNIVQEYFNKNPNQQFGDLSDKLIIKGTTIGEANSIIPLYICKEHWINTKKYIDVILGIILSNNPFNVSEQSFIVFDLIFIHFIKSLFNKNNLNNTFIRTFFCFYRTCAQLCFDKKYNHGIKKLIDNYMFSSAKRTTISGVIYERIIMQSTTTGYVLPKNKIQQLIVYFIEELIKTQKKLIETNNNNNDLVEQINYKLQDDYVILYNYYIFNQIIDNIIQKSNTYSNFIKTIDNNYGLVDDDFCDYIKAIINNISLQSINSIENLCKGIEIDYNIEYWENFINSQKS